MNRYIRLLICLALTSMLFQCSVFAESGEVRIIIDSVQIRSKPAIYIEDGKAMLPLRMFVQAAGLAAQWNAETAVLTVDTGQGKAVFTANDRIVVIGGKAVPHVTAPKSKNADLYIDAESLVHDFRVKLQWNEHTKAVVIETPISFYIQNVLRAKSFLSYKGETQNGIPHGKGRWFRNGSLWYEGQFADGQMHGMGKLYRNGKLLYEGAFSGNLPNGSGKIYENAYRYYVGDVRDGFPEGEGSLYIRDRLAYSGEWSYGYMQGIGKMYDSHGREVYAGGFGRDKREGYGVEYKEGKKTYAGSWVQGKKNGNGKLYDNKGEIVYAGTWKDGERNGDGIAYRHETITWYRTEGKTVPGELKRSVTYAAPVVYHAGVLTSEGKAHLYLGADVSNEEGIAADNDEDHLNGTAEIRIEAGSEVTEAGVLFESDLVYLGSVRDGKRQGFGQEYADGGLVYIGDFESDVRDGTGQSYKNGLLVYDGEWTNGQENGKGRSFVYEDLILNGSGNVTISDGVFKDGKPVSENNRYRYTGEISGGAIGGNGVMFELLAGGKTEKVYEGHFHKSRYHGIGKLYKQGKLVFEGSFVDGKRDGEGKSFYALSSLIEYEGTFAGDLFEGAGKLYRNGNRLLYAGQFHAGAYHGSGKLYYDVFGAGSGAEGKTGLEYEGSFRNGLKHGYGKQYSIYGALVYEGEFVNGTPKGTGN